MGDHKGTSDTQGYRFMKETIKNRPIDRRGLFFRVVFLIGGAVIFGTVAAVVFSLVCPVVVRESGGRQAESQEVEIPKDELKETGVPGQTDTPTPQVVEVPRKITLDDYDKIYNEILAISAGPRKALVHVSGIQGEEDLLDNTVLSSGETEGIIFEENESELFILTGLSAILDAEKVKVSFTDGSTVQAAQIKGDPATGLAVVRVPTASIKKKTLTEIAVASLGNSYSLVQGKSVIAIGCPTGYNDSVLYGHVTSVSNKVPVTDMEYNLLTTDILGSGTGSGVLLDTAGSIIGIIAMSYGPEDTRTMVKALSVSQLKPLIENLSNGKNIAYMGIWGQEVSEEMAQSTQISGGIFVERVEEDSPAMEAGIQRGDVITAFNKKNIHTMQRFYTELQKCGKGQKVQVAIVRKGAEGYGQTKINVTLDVK